ncbi:hypothetical protein DPMN_088764 [Dreissena polymorpha]|uniref:Uncharacterized protein n=1 Tax=Dreissena polymorpha TaxID=45954 RepID=A0A9D4QXE6_DREPO|nr:hypothetical protein DPMN_088764 [Dreissena polymorpha]
MRQFLGIIMILIRAKWLALGATFLVFVSGPTRRLVIQLILLKVNRSRRVSESSLSSIGRSSSFSSSMQ